MRANLLILVASLALLFTGCGQDRHSDGVILSGQVSFDGMPVPAGIIKFEPDASRGGKGQAVYTRIYDGEYLNSKPVSQGAHIVTISGYDGTSEVNESEGFESKLTTPIFNPFSKAILVESSQPSQSFDVPASAR